MSEKWGRPRWTPFCGFVAGNSNFRVFFKFDLIATSAYAAATVYLYNVSAAQSVATLAEIGFFVVILLLQIAKIMLVFLLDSARRQLADF